MRIGITGTIASGKTTFSKMLRQRGMPVFNADQYAIPKKRRWPAMQARSIHRFRSRRQTLSLKTTVRQMI